MLVRWIGLGAAVSVVPLMSGLPGSRNLIVPGVGVTTALAVLVVGAVRRARSARARPRIVDLAAAALGASVLWFAIVGGPWRWAVQAVQWHRRFAVYEEIMRQPQFTPDDREDARFVFLTCAQPIVIDG